MIDLTINKTGLEHNLRKAKENRIIIPTIAQMQHPETIPEKIRERLKTVGLWDVDPLNLFRITWKNEAKESGGLFQAVPNYIELPPALTGVPARIIALVGKVLGLYRDHLLAVYYGTGMAANAFNTASRIPRVFFDAVFASAISACFIPVFSEYLTRKGRELLAGKKAEWARFHRGVADVLSGGANALA